MRVLLHHCAVQLRPVWWFQGVWFQYVFCAPLACLAWGGGGGARSSSF
jgi:hypothetical protein